MTLELPMNQFCKVGNRHEELNVLIYILCNQAFMILFKSKQQVLSRTDLNQEHLKIEQHSTNLIGTLDAQVSNLLNK